MARKAEVKVGANITEFQKKMAMVQREFASVGRGLSDISNSIRNSISLPFAAAGIAGVTMAAQYEDVLIKINTLVGLTGDEFKSLKASIEQVSEATGQSKELMAQAAFAIVSAGLRGAEAQDLLAQSAKASAIGLGEQKEVARAGTAAMQTYGSKIITAAKSMDILTAIVREGNLEASELAPAIGKVIAIAGPLGVSFEEVGANIAVFTRLGLSAAEVVTSLRGVLNSLLKPTSEASEELAKYGLTFEQLRTQLKNEGLAATLQGIMAMTDGNVESLGRIIPSVEALANVLGTAGAQGEAYAQVLQNIQNSAGMVDNGFNTYAQGGMFNYKTALNAVKDAGIELGNALAPMVQQLGDAVRNAAAAFRNLSEDQKMTIIQITAFTAALPLVLSPLAALATMLGSVGSALSKLAVSVAAGNPLTIGLLAMGVAVAGVVVFWDEFKNAVESVTTSMANMYNNATGVRQALAGIVVVFKGIGRVGLAVIQDVIGQLQSLWDALQMFKNGNFTIGWDILGKVPEESSARWNEMIEGMKQDWMDTQADFRQALTPISSEQVQGAVDKMISPLQKVKELWSSLFGSTESTAAISGITKQLDAVGVAVLELGGHSDRVANEFNSNLSRMKSGLIEIQAPLAGSAAVFTEAWKESAQSISEAFDDMFNNITATFIMGIGAALSGGDISGLFDSVMLQIANFLEYFGRTAINIGGIVDAIIKALQTLGGGPLVIAAGIGALMLAGAIKSNIGRNSAPTAFANGGIVYGPTTALVGEYAGAANNPEVIAPLDKLRGLMQPSGSGKLYGHLRGQDLFISNDRYRTNTGRITGGG